MTGMAADEYAYLPCIHQLSDLIQGRPVWGIKPPPVEDST